MSTTEKLKKNNKKIKAFEVNCIKLYKNAEKETITTRRNKIKVQPWTTVKELKSIISDLNNIQSKNIRLFFEKFELRNDLSMNDYHILEKKHPKIFYEIIDNNEDCNFEIKVYGTFPCCDSLKKIIRKIYYAFVAGLNPILVEDGTSGTYKLRNPEKEIVGIFKPFDEEPFAPNNNKNNVGKFGSETFRKGILSGEGTIREVAAYILDKKDKNMENIFDVPPTTFVEISHPFFNKNNEEMLYIDEDIDNILKNGLILQFLNEKISSKKNNIHIDNKKPYLSSKKYNYITRKYGSLQKFIESTGVVADYSYSLFTIEEAHKIMILDFRILNCDRNDENILLIKEKKKNNKKDFYKLIPIDHALSFPSCLKIGDYEMCWMTWSQAEQPFTKKEKEYIENIDIISDMQRLNENINLREDCWKFFRISNTILKIGAKYDLTPFEIGSLMYTLDYDKKEPSKIELIIQKTDNLCSCLKVDKRLRLFSAGCKEETEPEERKNKFTKIHTKKKTSLLERTTSEPKKKANEDNDNSSNDEYSGLKSNGNKKEKQKKEKLQLSRASSISQEIVFDSPYNELYFSHFIVFLKELIKNEYPEKAKIYEENLEIEEEKNLKNYEYNLNIIETNKDSIGEEDEG